MHPVVGKILTGRPFAQQSRKSSNPGVACDKAFGVMPQTNVVIFSRTATVLQIAFYIIKPVFSSSCSCKFVSNSNAPRTIRLGSLPQYAALWMLTLRPLGSDAQPQSPRGTQLEKRPSSASITREQVNPGSMTHRTAVLAAASEGK